MKILHTLLAISLGTSAIAQQSTLITNVNIHTAAGNIIQNGAVGIENGKITYVGTKAAANGTFTTILDGKNGELYPGFIAPNVTLGLIEIESIRATRDAEETGEFNPNVRSLIAYNAESDVTATAVTNGVLTAQITPRGGVISGSSSIVKLKAWNWEDAAYKKDDGIHLNWPMPYEFRGWWAEPGGVSKSKKYDEQYLEMVQFLKEAKAYNQTSNHKLVDLRFNSMKGIFTGESTLFVHANMVRQLREAIELKKSMGILKMVIVGGIDAIQVANELKENNIPVILERVHSLPTRAEDDIDLPYKLPFLLTQAGVLVCLNNEGDMEQAGVRNLPFYAGTAAAYGLDKEEALKTITINTAKILGIDKQTGSIEVGKDATFFISTGDALDMKSNKLTAAWILGENIDLNNRQIDLYNRYKSKYEKSN